MKVIESARGMQSTCRRLVRDGKSIRFVPTMGALHDGHGSLIKRAVERDAHNAISHHNDQLATRQDTDHADDTDELVVVVSIFANPIQFNDSKDFANYPSTLETDLELCKRFGVDYVFVPKCDDIYPSNPTSCDKRNENMVTTSGRCIVKPPTELAQILEGRSRLGHFEGMLTVVCKLFNIIQPDRAYFGIKDYQQLVLVTKMAEDLNFAVRICPVETVRESETNLPLSSRNTRLALEQKWLAARLMYDTLVSTKKCLEEKCRRGNQLRSDCANGNELNMILLASMMTSQLWLDLGDSDLCESHRYDVDSASSRSAQATIDYYELRCAKDLSTIDYDYDRELYDCQRGCIRRRLLAERKAKVVGASAILEARLLIAILVSKVRLLDNIGVQLNL